MVVYGSIKIKKLPSPDVWDYKIWLKCRMAFPFVSACRYDRNSKVFKVIWTVLRDGFFFGLFDLRCRCEVGSSWFFIPKKFKGCAMPSRKNIWFSSHFEKVVDFWKKSTSDFSWIAKRWVFFLYPLCFRLKWVKSGEKRKYFF